MLSAKNVLVSLTFGTRTETRQDGRRLEGSDMSEENPSGRERSVGGEERS